MTKISKQVSGWIEREIKNLKNVYYVIRYVAHHRQEDIEKSPLYQDMKKSHEIKEREYLEIIVQDESTIAELSQESAELLERLVDVVIIAEERGKIIGQMRNIGRDVPQKVNETLKPYEAVQEEKPKREKSKYVKINPEELKREIDKLRKQYYESRQYKEREELKKRLKRFKEKETPPKSE